MELGPNQKKWLETLESDEYSQTQGCLRKGDKYCCLGVACDIFMNPKEDSWHFNGDIVKGEKKYYLAYTYASEILLSSNVANEAVSNTIKLRSGGGMCTLNPEDRERLERLLEELVGREKFKRVHRYYRHDPPTLFELNDDYGLTFKQIAQVIRQFPHGYFTEPA